MRIYPSDKFFWISRRVLLALFILFIILETKSICNLHAAKTAESRSSKAIREGDPAEALAQAIKASTVGRYPMRNEKLINQCLAVAYECSCDYDAALALCYNERDDSLGNQRARLAFKRGDWQTAFESYCDCLEEAKRRENKPSDAPSLEFKNRIRTEMTLELKMVEMRLSPFFEFSDFMFFMEKEYASLGSPEEYKSAMEFFRAIANAEEPLGYSVLEEKPRKVRGFIDKSRIPGSRNEVLALKYINGDERFVKKIIQSRLDLRHELKRKGSERGTNAFETTLDYELSDWTE